jgi:ABC-type multidrug transport system fused ATPase/permease subunit
VFLDGATSRLRRIDWLRARLAIVSPPGDHSISANRRKNIAMGVERIERDEVATPRRVAQLDVTSSQLPKTYQT